MSSAEDDEAYWSRDDKNAFNFESTEGDQSFNILQSDRDEPWTKAPNTNYQSLKPVLSVISEKTLSCILAADKLQKCYQETGATQPDITLRKILLGQPYSLEQYKSLASKTALLDAAIATGDGNAVLVIILHLSKTLKRSFVQRLLVERPDAVNIYIHYLSIRLQINEITDILTMLSQPIDAAMKTLHIIIKNTPDPDRLLQKLRNSHKTQFSALSGCKESLFVQSYIKLLEWQMVVKKMDGFEELFLNAPLCESLRHACRVHWNSPEGILMAPKFLLQQHDMSSKQYQKVALQVKATAGEWEDIDRLLLTRGWLGDKKLQTSLPIEDVVKVMHKSHAPSEVLEKYLKFVDNIEKRLQLAKNFKCYRIVIDLFVLQGDRTALMEYKTKLQPQSEEYFYAESSLRLPSVKWKN